MERSDIIGGEYKIFRKCKLGKGAFGKIYNGIKMSNNELVAIKIESSNIDAPQLMHEGRILSLLQTKGKIIFNLKRIS
ncbi:MAG: hypothetical protein MJ252_27125 [archaeon]|nr:hypothetical protein [archaeon]